MRHDDQSNPKIISHKVRCYNCQRPAQAEKKTFYGTKPGEKYRGNLPIKKETPRNSVNYHKTGLRPPRGKRG